MTETANNRIMIFGPKDGGETARDAWTAITGLLKSGQVKPIVAKTFPLEGAAEALRYLVEGRPLGRVALRAPFLFAVRRSGTPHSKFSNSGALERDPHYFDPSPSASIFPEMRGSMSLAHVPQHVLDPSILFTVRCFLCRARATTVRIGAPAKLRQRFDLRLRMNGQWLGDYVGTNQGALVLDLDEVGDHYEGSAVALESNPSLPPTLALLLNVPKGQKSFQLRTPLMPIDRVSGRAVSWDELKKNYPSDVTAPNYADTKWEVGTGTIEISWVTDIGTNGTGLVRKSRSKEPSELIPLPQVTTWEEYRRFARALGEDQNWLATRKPAEFETGSGARDAAPTGGSDDCCDHARDPLAAALGPRLLRRWVRKKLGLDLNSEKVGGDRIYRIVDTGGTRPASRRSRRRAA